MPAPDLQQLGATPMPGASAPRAEAKLSFGVMTKLIGVQIRRAQLAIYADFMRRAPVRGLTPGQLAILIIIDQNAELTQQQLCEGIGVEKSTLVVRLHRLADRGLIRRVRSRKDRRQNILELTAQGKTKLRAMLTFVAEHERRMVSELSEAERKQLSSLLAKIR
jgi:DNA-binding MarR family transcriptional regulator